jgi:chorismate mutase
VTEQDDQDSVREESVVEALTRYREEIERIDRALVGLLAERLERSKRIGSLKRHAGMPTLDPGREAEVLRRAATTAREHGLPDDTVRDLFWHVIAMSRGAQT